jgi:putative toxin-antitoxin system antitoxin component (TIGR02293 family)
MTVAAITAVMGGRKVFKGLQAERADLTELTREGLPVAAFLELSERLGVDKKRLAAILGISERTLSRRLASDQRLTRDESDRTMRLARIFAKAEDTFGRPEKAARWMQTPNLALGDEVPLELLDTDAGARTVEEVLYRIDYGMFS